MPLPTQPSTCSFCDELAVSSYMVREGQISPGYNKDPHKNPDKSGLRVVKVCQTHKRQVPR